MKSVGLKPYKPKLIHGLWEDILDRRTQLSEVMLNEIKKLQ